MYGPQIQLCLFTFRPIALKHLKSLTTIDTYSWLGGPLVAHPTGVREVPGSIPGSSKDFYAKFSVLGFIVFLSKTHYQSRHLKTETETVLFA